jgi:hypothetical protein
MAWPFDIPDRWHYEAGGAWCWDCCCQQRAIASSQVAEQSPTKAGWCDNLNTNARPTAQSNESLMLNVNVNRLKA